MRIALPTAATLAVMLAVSPAALAAKPKPAPAAAPAAPATAPAKDKDVVVAIVNGHPIHLSEVDAAVQELPQQARNVPPAQLYPILVDQLVDREALVLAARKQNLQNDPALQPALQRAADQVLQNALLRRDVGPQINEAALRAIYDKSIGNKPGEEEVQASHILVPTEDQAKDIIKQIKGGADFATLAKKYSTDPTGKQNGGDLGYFKKADMLPEFSNAAFALKAGEVTQAPVKTRYGWHVIKVFNRRLSSPPSFSESQGQLQQELVQSLIQEEVAKAKQGLTIQMFNSDGSPAVGKPAAIAAPASAMPPGMPPATPPAPAKK